jgi:hypothetical protein
VITERDYEAEEIREESQNMSDMERARRAGGSGIPFTAIVVVAILICIGLLVWRASSGDANNSPASIGRNG